jgi:hypothetical protein
VDFLTRDSKVTFIPIVVLLISIYPKIIVGKGGRKNIKCSRTTIEGDITIEIVN